MKKTALIFAALLFTAHAAMALDLQSARRAGQVAEKRDGYVAAVQNSAEVKALVNDVNARRKAEYQRISAGNGQPVDVVAKLASPQIIQNLAAGELYESDGGGWKKR